ncbi:MAG: hypothetical protein AAF384_19345 [Pseudomonadota bacterium]
MSVKRSQGPGERGAKSIADGAGVPGDIQPQGTRQVERLRPV